MKRLLKSIVISAILTGVLLGNAYLKCHIGYPSFLDWLGNTLLFIGLILAIPPGMIWAWLGNMGLVPELRGRESFIMLNPGLWIFCFLFYVFVTYLIITAAGRFKRNPYISVQLFISLMVVLIVSVLLILFFYQVLKP